MLLSQPLVPSKGERLSCTKLMERQEMCRSGQKYRHWKSTLNLLSEWIGMLLQELCWLVLLIEVLLFGSIMKNLKNIGLKVLIYLKRKLFWTVIGTREEINSSLLLALGWSFRHFGMKDNNFGIVSNYIRKATPHQLSAEGIPPTVSQSLPLLQMVKYKYSQLMIRK